jgi:branched-chain amino acid transport system permease protein
MQSGRFKTSYRAQMRLVQTGTRWIWIVLLAAFLFYLPHVLTDRRLLGIELTQTQLLGMSVQRLNFAIIAVIGAIGLNLLTGYTGLISLGNAAFFAFGAMAAAIFGEQLGWPFLVTIVVAGLFGALVGVLIGVPSLRLRGLYLLMATLALHYVADFVLLRYQTAFWGPAGIRFEDPTIGSIVLDEPIEWYYVLVAITTVIVLMSINLIRTREGRAFVSVRDQDIAAASAGINISAAKLKSFAFSSFLVSVGGALYAYYLTNVNHELFSLLLAIQFIAMIIIGGLGSILGAILGALVWQLLPTVIRTLSDAIGPDAPLVGGLLSDHAPQLNNIILGLVIILVIVFKPEGLNGMWTSVRRFFQRWPYTT